MKAQSNILNKSFDFEAIHLQLSFDENFWLKDSYNIIINGQSFSYFSGIGHRVEKNSYSRDEAKKWLNFSSRKNVESYNYLVIQLNTFTKPKPLNIDDILYCLVLDSYCGSLSFDDFCDDFGYSNDSINHLNLYRECSKTAKKLQKIGINIDEANELFQDY